jgi:hypothetical protein
MREHAEELFSAGDQVAGDPFAAETLGRHLSRRIAELADNPDTPLSFGKLDIDEDDGGGPGFTSVGGTSLMWPASRWCWTGGAPISRKFYQASVKDPQGVANRRRSVRQGRTDQLRRRAPAHRAGARHQPDSS